MRNTMRMLLPLCAVVLVSLAAPTEALAKCVERIGHPVLPGFVFIVDGQVVGEYAMGEQPPYPPSEQILLLEVTCRPSTDPARSTAQQAAVVVVTKSGARTLLRSYLTDLVEAQRQHRARHGEYASTASELGFFESRVSLPMRIELSRNAWSATATFEGSDIVCTVASRNAGTARTSLRAGAAPRLASRPDIPRCSRTE